MKAFDFVKAINEGNDIISLSDNPKLAENIYVPFLTNRAFSYFSDTIYFANEMNRSYMLDNKLQFDFYINIVRPKKRFAKWAKSGKTGDVSIIMEYYGYSKQKAMTALSVLNEEQIELIKRKVYKGE
jgi:hypothetical protein